MKINLTPYLRLDAAVLSASGVSFVVGAAIASYVTMRNLKAKYEKRADEEIAQVREYYKVVRKEGDLYSDPVALLESKIDELGYDSITADVDGDISNAEDVEEEYQGPRFELQPKGYHDEVVKTQSIFDQQVTEKEASVDDEDEELIYVISRAAFLSNETDYEQVAITYFEGDDVFVDNNDQIIDRIDLLLGEETPPFGKHSNDNNIVYIRNENFEAEFEVTRSKGSYTSEVLGFNPEDITPPIKKFRRLDE